MRRHGSVGMRKAGYAIAVTGAAAGPVSSTLH